MSPNLQFDVPVEFHDGATELALVDTQQYVVLPQYLPTA